MIQRQESLIIQKPGHLCYLPGAREHRRSGVRQQTPTPENNTQGLGEQMQSSIEATQRCPQRYASLTSKYQFFQRHVRQYRALGIRRLRYFRPRISRLGLAQMETPDRTVKMMRVHSPGSTNH